MNVLVISGFLGAGKTTFIQELARRSGHDFAVYENEYGQTDIDAAQLTSQNNELSVWESTENCICCSGKQDFATNILTISSAIDPEFLVVEPTGIARLSSIIQNINQVRYERIGLLAPLTIVDAGNWRHQRAGDPELFDDQVASAHTVVVSKSERALSEELDALATWISKLNPAATIIRTPYAQQDNAWFEALLHQEIDPATHELITPASSDAKKTGGQEPDGRAEDFESLSLEGVELASESQLIFFLNALVAGVFGRVSRAKGQLLCGGQWLRFDVVDQSWSVIGQDMVSTSAAVIIGKELKRSWLRSYLLPGLAAHAAQAEEHADVHEHHEHAHEHHDHDHAHDHDHIHDHEEDHDHAHGPLVRAYTPRS